MLRRPGFSAIVVALLAVGLGSTTAVFSRLYSVVLKPPPYPSPNELVVLHNRFPGLHLERLPASTLDYVDLRRHHELFANSGVFYFLDLNRTGIPKPEKVNAVAASASLFETLGVMPVLGRNFTAPHTVILSDTYWRTEFASDPAILNRSLQLNGELYPIVGVMPASFQFPNPVTQMWVPVVEEPKWFQPAARQAHWLRMYARLAPGLTFAQASQRMEDLSRQMSLEHPDDYPLDRLGWRFFLTPMAEEENASLRHWLKILFAAVACLWLIVCANVTGLFLVRSTERQFEFAIRMALGATRFRIARHVLAETFLLSTTGAVCACWAAQGPVALLFLVAASILTGLVCGIYPAFWAPQSLKPGRQHRLRSTLIVSQVAIATTLLITGGLLLHSMVRLLETPPGFDPHNVWTAQVSLPGNHYKTKEQRAQFYEALLERLRHLPGVGSAAGCTLLPFGWGENANTFEIVGRPKPKVEPYANLNNITPDFFRTLNIPVLRGRVFSPTDRDPLVIIDAAMASRYFAGQDPLGQQVKMPWGPPLTIIGVVGPVKTAGLDTNARPTLYFSFSSFPSTDMTLAVRSPLPERALTNAVSAAVSELDHDQPIHDVFALQARIDRTLQTRRLVVSLILCFAIAGTLLAALGLYGALSFAIALRRREIGIRMALGASARTIAGSVARTGFLVTILGFSLGALGALAAARSIESQLYDTKLHDLSTWLVVATVLLISCSFACALPAWRASRMDPMQSLREE